MNRFQDKVAVVTGGNSGIGRAIARELHREGAKVALFGRSGETLEATRRELGNETLAVQGDVSSTADLDRLYSQVADRHGRIDVLIANAGIAPVAPVSSADEAHVDSLLDVNVKGLFFTVQKALGLLSEKAAVLLTSSTLSYRGMPGLSVYAATKAAVRSLGRGLQAELAPRGIRVNVLSPGPIETPIYGRMQLPEDESRRMAQGILGRVPAGRFGQPEEMARAALFLVSEEASYIYGADLLADGGLTTV